MSLTAEELTNVIEELGKTLVQTQRKMNTDKPYLTKDQAAFFCCMSIRQLEYEMKANGIHPLTVGGKKVYRRTALGS